MSCVLIVTNPTGEIDGELGWLQILEGPLSRTLVQISQRQRNVVIQGHFPQWENLGSRRTIDCADYGVKARPDWILVHANAENVVSLSHTHLQNTIFSSLFCDIV